MRWASSPRTWMVESTMPLLAGRAPGCGPRMEREQCSTLKAERRIARARCGCSFAPIRSHTDPRTGESESLASSSKMQEAEHAMFQIITVAAFFVVLAAPVNAQTFPDRPVRVLVLTRPGVSPTLRRDL